MHTCAYVVIINENVVVGEELTLLMDHWMNALVRRIINAFPYF